MLQCRRSLRHVLDGGARGRRFGVALSENRLRQFLEAELTHMRYNYRPKSLRSALKSILQLEQMSEHERSFMLSTEVPSHYAHRVGQLELLSGKLAPPTAVANPVSAATKRLAGNYPDILALDEVCNSYRTSFYELRQLAMTRSLSVVVETDGFDDDFEDILEDLNKRHQSTMPRISGGISEMRRIHDAPENDLRDFWEDFFLSRVFTEMLIRQYRSVLNDDSVVKRDASLKDICQQAFDDALVHTKTYYDDSPSLPQEAIVDGIDVKFHGLSMYVYFIIFEVTKNALKAYMRDVSGRPPLPMHYTCAADDLDCAVRISDGAGGMPRQVVKNIWSYADSSTPPTVVEGGALHKKPKPESYQRPPIAGWGCGLPIARLYANFMGGSLTANVLPGHGTDIFLDFARDLPEYAKTDEPENCCE